MQHRELPDGWDKDLPTFPADAKGMASRDSSGKVLNAIAKNVPWLIGGSADLAPSTKTRLTFEGAGDFEAGNYGGRNFHFGIREHAMGAILNGMSLSKVRPYGSGFLIFSDYGRPPIRLAAIMEIPVIYVFTHDSIGVGEDGPTHQPIEQLALAAGDPRPDRDPARRRQRGGRGVEGDHAARSTSRRCSILTRQDLPTLDRTKYAPAVGLAQGRLRPGRRRRRQAGRDPDGTGSEVSLCVEAYEQLKAEGVKARVVSMPSLGAVRAPGRRRTATSVLPAGGHGARLRRAGVHLRLGNVRRPDGRDDRHEDLRRVGPAQGPAEEVRVHRRTRRRGRPRASSSRGPRRCPPDDDRHRRRPRWIRAQAAADRLARATATTSRTSGPRPEPVDYPDAAARLARAVLDGGAERGILVCGSGVGASVAANKLPGIRAGLCHDTYSAHQGVEHDDMNVLVLGARVIGPRAGRELVRAFLAARFSHAERHERRLAKIRAIEEEQRRGDT